MKTRNDLSTTPEDDNVLGSTDAESPDAGESPVQDNGHEQEHVSDSADAPNTSGKEAASDPFNPEDLKVSKDSSEALGVKKVTTTVPTEKPSRWNFIRVHPGEEYRLTTGVLELKEQREIFLVLPKLLPDLAGEPSVGLRMLVTGITRHGALFLWPLRLPSDTGRLDRWGESALEAAEIAQGNWIRVSANMSLGAYDIFQAMGDLPEPNWPDLTFHEILKIAFKGRLIDSLNHPVLRELRGEF